jgi:ATP phosphoribosyltransferase regulatory subunit
MTDDPPPNTALLPAGLRDLLPPEAETEAEAVACLMGVFDSHGYRRVKPPLLEFEDSLLAGSGAAMADQTYRLMDTNTRRMMGLRADMTPQVARIAATRLGHSARPLRLSYAGQCLRVHANQLAPDRQIAQAGIELIGHDSPEADAEIVLVGAEALHAVGLARLSIDLTMPPLVPTLLEENGMDPGLQSRLGRALDRKDVAAVRERGGVLAGLLTDLLLAAGPSARALEALKAAALSPGARQMADRIAATVAAIHARAPELKLTIDPIEFRGLRYHTGVCMTVYAPGRHEELGRGGRYICGENEPATGLTLYPDAILRATPPRPARMRIYLPAGTPPELGSRHRAGGFATVAGLDATLDATVAATRLGCTHLLVGEDAVAIGAPAGTTKSGVST